MSAAACCAAIALAYPVRDALIDDRVLLVAAFLELALLVQVVTGIAQGAGRSGNWEKGVFAYLLSVPLVVPGAVLLAIRRSRDSVWRSSSPPLPSSRSSSRGSSRSGVRMPDRELGAGPGRLLTGGYAVRPRGHRPGDLPGHRGLPLEGPVGPHTLRPGGADLRPATVALVKGGDRWRRIATVAISVELVGVLVVGLVSYLVPSLFPDKTVWSHFGSGYGYVPLVLPVVGLWWLRRVSR